MRKPTVLVVEDNADTALSLRDVLQSFLPDINVILVANANAALERLGQQPVDLIIADHRLPGMSGADLLRTLDRRRSTTRRILISAFLTQAQTTKVARDVGADAAFLKPFDIPELKEKVATLLHTPAPKSDGLRARDTEPWERFIQP